MHRRLSFWIDCLVNFSTKLYPSTQRLCHLKNLRLWLIGCVSSKSTLCNAGQKAEVSRSSNSSHSAALGSTQLDPDKSEKVHILAQICCLHNLVFCKLILSEYSCVLLQANVHFAHVYLEAIWILIMTPHLQHEFALLPVQSEESLVECALSCALTQVYNIMVQVVLLGDIQHAPMARSRFYSSKAKELIQQVLKQKLTGVVYDPELAPLLVKEITEDVKMGLKGAVFLSSVLTTDVPRIHITKKITW